MTLAIATLCHYPECRVLFVVIQNAIMLTAIMLTAIMLSVVMLSVVMLSVIMLSVVMLSVVVPIQSFKTEMVLVFIHGSVP
jgi:hypothetical protein